MNRLVLIAFAGAVLLITAKAQSTMHVGPNVQVSLEMPNRRFREVQIAAHPRDPSRLLACSMFDLDRINQGGPSDVAFTSTDGGRSWRTGPLIGGAADPVCQYGPDGQGYFGGSTSEPPNVPLDHGPRDVWRDKYYFFLSRSLNGADTWEHCQSFWAGDRPWLVVDRTDGAPADRIWLTYQSRVNALDEDKRWISLNVVTSSDGGASWIPYAYGVSGPSTKHFIPVGLAQLSDRTLIVLGLRNLPRGARFPYDQDSYAGSPLDELPTDELRVTLISSHSTFRNEPKTVKVSDRYWPLKVNSIGINASLAVDSKSVVFRDRIYVAWADRRSGSGRIMMSWSPDRGKTWVPPRVVDDILPEQGREVDNFMPTIAVNNMGIVGVTWYDRRDSSEKKDYSVRFTASKDGGETWLPSVVVSDQPARLLMAETSVRGYVGAANDSSMTLRVTAGRGGDEPGDTAGLVSDASGVFHSIWVDNRTGINQIFTAPIVVNVIPVKHGDDRLAVLDDITERITLQLTNLSYDAGTQILTVEAKLWNRSAESVRGPIIARVVGLDSDMGRITVLNSDNNANGISATFDFTSLMQGGQLKPKESLFPKKLRFRLDKIDFKRWSEIHPSLRYLNLELRFFATAAGQ